MAVAVTLNAVSLLFVMGPSLVTNLDLLVTEFYTAGSIITSVHAVMGSLAEVLGIWLVLTWLFRSSTAMTCAKRKRVMQTTILLWFTATILGVSFYIFYYI